MFAQPTGRNIVAALAAVVLLGDARPPARPSPFADSGDAVLAARGKAVYAANCASCHGRYLQGQPLWRMADGDKPRRAPALDGTGPEWQHSDDELFAAIRDGNFPSNAPGPRSRMPAFGTVMTDQDMLAVLAFMKARWPTALRVAHAAMNPGGTARPQNADGDWRFPPGCKPR